MINRYKILGLIVLLLAFAGVAVVALSFAAPARAQAQSGEASISYPVAELGNCGSKEACKSYCNNPANMEACVSFAQAHGLMNKDEAAKAQKFGQALQSGGGPGGCRSPQECDRFCSTLANLDTCIKFAEEQGIKDENITEGKKIQTYLRSGGQMPGGCTSKESCDNYCGDFSHAKECMEFSQKTGVGPRPGEGPDKDLSPEQAQRLMELVSSGQSPGGCKTKDQCESYCQDSAHFEECANFAQKAGLMNEKDAEMMRKTGGKGPGGCNSKQSCEAFCNDPANREACFNFAKEHNLISEADLKQMQEGTVRMRQGLENAPAEVVACLKSTLGPNVIEQIQSGTLVPGPTIGDTMKNCFDKFGQRMSPNEGMNKMPPEMESCVKTKLGDTWDKIKSGQTQMTPEMGDVFRVCGEQMRLMNPNMGGPNGPEGQGGPNGGPGGPGGPGSPGMGGPSPEALQGFLRSAPQEIQSCLQEKLGGDFEALRSGQKQPGSDIGDKMKSCFESFKPQRPEDMRGGPGQSGPGGPNGGPMGPGQNGPMGPRPEGNGPQINLPPQVAACVKSAVGEGAFEAMSRGQADQGVQNSVGECMRRFQEEMNRSQGPTNSPMPPQGMMQPGQPTGPIPSQNGPGVPPPPPGSVPPPSGDMQGQIPMGTQIPMDAQAPQGSYVPPPSGETAPPPDYVKPPETTTAPPPADTTAAPPPSDTTTAPPPPPADSTAIQPAPGLLFRVFAPLLGF